MSRAALVIMAAGLGSRYGGNKQIDGVGPRGETLMEYSVFDAVRAGFDKIVFIIKPELYDLLRETCGRQLERTIQVEYAFQTVDSVLQSGRGSAARVKPYGTVHAMLSARAFVREPFAILNADDYYGVGAFSAMYREITRMPEAGAACMAGYRLADTLSPNGKVSRGVCRVSGGKLRRIKELRGIIRDASGIRNTEGAATPLCPDEMVSMNFWGFSPWIFDRAEAYFDGFLKRLTPEDRDAAECLLPVMVNDMVDDGTLSVNVLTTDSKWFGVTYREDKAAAQQQLRRLHEDGVYPETLRSETRG